jgi:hypothetical protein
MTTSARRTGAVAALTTVALALAPAASAASAAKQVGQGNATLHANGAAITLPATFTCPGGYVAYLSVQVIQAIDDEFAGGFDTATKDCTGAKQRVTFFVQSIPAGENTHPFEVGPASSRVILDAVDPESMEPYYEEEVPEGEGESASPLPPLPPVTGAQYAIGEEPMPSDPAPTVHAEARGTIEIREKS